MALTCFAPAKINLALHVTGLAETGFHELESLVVFCDIGDRLSLRLGRDKSCQPRKLGFSGTFAKQLAADNDNLIWSAMELMQLQFDEAFRAYPSICFELDKQLPVASGIGGGSADAAAALILLRKGLKLSISCSELHHLAAKLGSDVPMCLYSKPLLARGRGTKTHLIDLPALYLVLVNPGISVSTPDIFNQLENKENAMLDPLPKHLDASRFFSWLADQRNDLGAPALKQHPEIQDVLNALQSCEAVIARMSGSGATCFGLYRTEEEADIAAKKIAENNSQWWVRSTQSQAYGIDRAKSA